MLKIFKPFIIIFKIIYRIIDKLIVIPVSRVVYKIGEISRDNSTKFEKILNRPNILIYLSLFCAVAIFLLVDSKVLNLTDHNAQIIEDQKVKVIYNEESYVVEGVPESVDITLIGDKSNIYLATQLGQHEIELDLSKYGVGTYKIPLKCNGSIGSIDYKLDPSTVTIKISEKISVKKNLSYNLLNEDKLSEKLSISNVELNKNQVVVKSSKEILDKVAVVKALVDASTIDLEESGSTTLENIELVAYDSLGNKINNVDIVPSKVSAKITIDSYHATKPVRVITEGVMSNGKAIASVTSSVKEVVIYGDKATVDKINYIEAPINVSKLDSNKTISVNLTKPTGVRFMNQTTSNIAITVGESSQKLVSGVSVSAINVAQDLVAQANEASGLIDVYVIGVDSIINGIDKANITATVDCSGLGRGTHTLPITVTVSNELVTVQTTKTEISVKIS